MSMLQMPNKRCKSLMTTKVEDLLLKAKDYHLLSNLLQQISISLT